MIKGGERPPAHVTHTERKTPMTTPTTYTATVFNEVAKLFDKLDKLNPDTKSNTGRLIGRAFIWDAIAKHAKGQSEAAWKTLESEEIIEYVESQGEHTLATSPHFTVIDKVSAPRKAFKPEVLAQELNKKYKVPVPVVKDLVERAKVPGEKGVHTSSIVEK